MAGKLLSAIALAIAFRAVAAYPAGTERDASYHDTDSHHLSIPVHYDFSVECESDWDHRSQNCHGPPLNSSSYSSDEPSQGRGSSDEESS
ncbi:hypothetical protein F4779DRAFT_573944 [Xylariaceae sp. FL0662B]|nr:hypothetical protein F4779DRAFT_573944 [Xylariaceae sp. FL0662B]